MYIPFHLNNKWDTVNTSQPKGCFWYLVANVNKNHIINEILNAIYCVFWIMDIRTQWIPNMETHSVNIIIIRTETRQRINEVSLQQNCLFICLFISKNHVRACLRITIAVLRQWQKWLIQLFGSIFNILLCLLSGKLILGSKT